MQREDKYNFITAMFLNISHQSNDEIRICKSQHKEYNGNQAHALNLVKQEKTAVDVSFLKEAMQRGLEMLDEVLAGATVLVISRTGADNFRGNNNARIMTPHVIAYCFADEMGIGMTVFRTYSRNSSNPKTLAQTAQKLYLWLNNSTPDERRDQSTEISYRATILTLADNQEGLCVADMTKRTMRPVFWPNGTFEEIHDKDKPDFVLHIKSILTNLKKYKPIRITETTDPETWLMRTAANAQFLASITRSKRDQGESTEDGGDGSSSGNRGSRKRAPPDQQQSEYQTYDKTKRIETQRAAVMYLLEYCASIDFGNSFDAMKQRIEKGDANTLPAIVDCLFGRPVLKLGETQTQHADATGDDMRKFMTSNSDDVLLDQEKQTLWMEAFDDMFTPRMHAIQRSLNSAYDISGKELLFLQRIMGRDMLAAAALQGDAIRLSKKASLLPPRDGLTPEDTAAYARLLKLLYPKIFKTYTEDDIVGGGGPGGDGGAWGDGGGAAASSSSDESYRGGEEGGGGRGGDGGSSSDESGGGGPQVKKSQKRLTAQQIMAEYIKAADAVYHRFLYPRYESTKQFQSLYDEWCQKHADDSDTTARDRTYLLCLGQRQALLLHEYDKAGWHMYMDFLCGLTDSNDRARYFHLFSPQAFLALFQAEVMLRYKSESQVPPILQENAAREMLEAVMEKHKDGLQQLLQIIINTQMRPEAAAAAPDAAGGGGCDSIYESERDNRVGQLMKALSKNLSDVQDFTRNALLDGPIGELHWEPYFTHFTPEQRAIIPFNLHYLLDLCWPSTAHHHAESMEADSEVAAATLHVSKHKRRGRTAGKKSTNAQQHDPSKDESQAGDETDAETVMPAEKLDELQESWLKGMNSTIFVCNTSVQDDQKNAKDNSKDI